MHASEKSNKRRERRGIMENERRNMRGLSKVSVLKKLIGC